MNELVIDIKEQSLLTKKSKKRESKIILEFLDNQTFTYNIGFYSLTAFLDKNKILNAELFVDDKFVTKFFITEKESYVFCPEIMDLHIEYNFKLILNENRK